jgi:hypothetical protein
MRAVFRAPNPYHQLGFDEVNNREPVLSEGYYKSADGGKKIFVQGHIVGVSVRHSLDPQMYIFSEGEDHNELTLTEPIEILNMRDWLKARKDFIEVSCDKEAESLTDADIATVNEASLPIEPLVDRAEDELSDWDYRLSELLRTR